MTMTSKISKLWFKTHMWKYINPIMDYVLNGNLGHTLNQIIKFWYSKLNFNQTVRSLEKCCCVPRVIAAPCDSDSVKYFVQGFIIKIFVS